VHYTKLTVLGFTALVRRLHTVSRGVLVAYDDLQLIIYLYWQLKLLLMRRQAFTVHLMYCTTCHRLCGLLR